MFSRAIPLVLVMLAACEPGGRAVNTPSALSPKDLVRKALESPGDGSDILEAVAEFESAEKWRKIPSGLVVSDSSLEAILEAQDGSVGVDQDLTNEEPAPRVPRVVVPTPTALPK